MNTRSGPPQITGKEPWLPAKPDPKAIEKNSMPTVNSKRKPASALALDEYNAWGLLSEADAQIPKCGTAEGALGDFSNAISKCVGLQAKGQRVFDQEHRQLAPYFAEAGSGSTVDSRSKVSLDINQLQDTASAQMKRKAAEQIRARVVEQFKAQGEELGKQCAQAGIEAQKAVARVRLAAVGYVMLRAGSSLTDSINRAQLENEIQAGGLDKFEDQYAANFAMATPEGDATCEKLELAAEKWIKEKMQGPKGKDAAARERLTGRGPAVDEFQQCRQLLTMFDQRRLRNIPPAVGISDNVIHRLLIPAFVEVVGLNAWDLSPGQMSAVLNGASGPGNFDIFPDWYLRTLPTTL
jgi:hypothetical protein